MLPIEELEATLPPPIEELIEGYGQLFGSAMHERWEAGGREIAHAIQSIPREDEEEMAADNEADGGGAENGAGVDGGAQGDVMQE